MKKITDLLKDIRYQSYYITEVILDTVWAMTHKEENARQIADLKELLKSIRN